MWCECLLVVAGLAAAFYVFFTRNSNYWKDRGIPFAEPTFFFGNFKDALLAVEHFGLMYEKLYRMFPGSPFVGLFKLRTPVLLVRDPEVLKKVMVTEFSSFTDNDFEVDLAADRIWASNPFSNKGATWKAVRARWVPHVSPAKVKNLYPSQTSRCQIMVDHINKMIKQDSKATFETRELATTFFTDSIVWGVFGVNVNSFETPDNPFRILTKSILVSTYLNGLLTTVFTAAPWLGKIFTLRFVTQEIEDKAIAIARDIMQCQKETGLPNNDIYNALTQYSKLDGKPGYTELDLAGRVFGMLLDGSETTSGPMSLGLYEVACNPDVQSKLRSELDKAAGETGEISYEDINQLEYLEMVFSEILRLFPPLLHLSRVCTKEVTLQSNTVQMKVPVGMAIAISIFGLHRDPEYFPDPLKFDPERFSPENIDKIPKFAYLPFGDGPRICLGMKLGAVESKVLLAHLVRNFEIRPATLPVPRPHAVDPNVFVMRSPYNLSVTFHPRTKGVQFTK